MRRIGGRVLAILIALLVIAAPAAATAPAMFQGPVFGLSTTANGSVVVADASSGVEKITPRGVKHVADLPGISDVDYARRAIWATTAESENPSLGGGSSVYRIKKGEAVFVADLLAFEEENNPDPAFVESNPWDIESQGRKAALVADAAGNDLLKVKRTGKVKALAVFPNELVSTADLKALVGCPDPVAPDFDGFCGLPDAIPAEAVPTSIAVGHGYYFVGELKGFPSPLEESNIWKVKKSARNAVCPSDDCMKAFDGGFTSIIDMTFGPDGYLYVAEMDELGWFAVEIGAGVGGTINKCDVDTGVCTEVATGIPILTAITFGGDGSLYATRNALIPGAAEVFKVE
jgi:hypothetical protein